MKFERIYGKRYEVYINGKYETTIKDEDSGRRISSGQIKNFSEKGKLVDLFHELQLYMEKLLEKYRDEEEL